MHNFIVPLQVLGLGTVISFAIAGLINLMLVVIRHFTKKSTN